jgi:hypothetical protein
MAAVLRELEKVVDVSEPTTLGDLLGLSDAHANLAFQTVAFGIIDNVESRAADLQREAASLGATLDVCINSYSGLSV